MLLILMQVHAGDGEPRDVSVWVDEADTKRATQRAIAALATAGWQHLRTLEVTSTEAGDYFRACPSQQAFQRAQTDGIAWRFSDDPETS